MYEFQLELVHELLAVGPAEVEMVSSEEDFKARHSVTNDVCSLLSSRLGGSGITPSDPHGNGHFIDCLDWNEIGLAHTLKVLGSPLLESVLHGVLRPVQL